MFLHLSVKVFKTNNLKIIKTETIATFDLKFNVFNVKIYIFKSLLIVTHK